MSSKVNQKINAIFVSKKIAFWSQHGPKMDPKWRPKSRKFVDISGYSPKTPPRRPNGGQGPPKWSQNGAQSEPHTLPRRPNGGQGAPKWRQNGAPRTKWRHNGDSSGSKRIVVVVVVAAGRAQLASERSERASGAIDEAKCSPKGARRSHNGAPREPKLEQQLMKTGRSTWICEDSQGFVGIRWDWPGFAGIRKDSLGFARIRWDSPGLGFVWIRWDS